MQTAVGNFTLRDKKCYMAGTMHQNRTFCSALYHWVSYVENPLSENLFSTSYNILIAFCPE